MVPGIVLHGARALAPLRRRCVRVLNVMYRVVALLSFDDFGGQQDL